MLWTAQVEFSRGLLDSVIKAASVTEMTAQRDREAMQADLFMKVVTQVRHAAVSDLVDARTAAMNAEKIAIEVRPAAVVHVSDRP